MTLDPVVKHPHVEVQLSGEDGNAFAIIARVIAALHEAGISEEEVTAFREEAFASGSYDVLLARCCEWVGVL